MVYHAGCALDLGVDTLEFFRQVVDLCITVAQALEHVDDGHAHHIQRLVDLMGQACGHFAEGGHFGALGQLLLGAAHFGVVAAHGLHFLQLALFVEHAPVRPHPPGMCAPRQLQADFGGAHREFRGELADAQYKRLVLFVRQPLAEVHARQLSRQAFHVVGQGRVAEGQGQVRKVAADHGRGVFHEDSIALLAFLDPLRRQGRLGHIQPQAHGFHGQPEVVAQQPGFIQQPVVIALCVEHPVATAHAAFAQQLAGTVEVEVAVFGVDPLVQRRRGEVGQGAAKQRQQAVAEEHRLQRALDVALHIDHSRGTGDQVIQACVGGGGLLLLVFYVADVEHEAHQAAMLTRAQRLPLHAIPDGVKRRVGTLQAHAGGQRFAQGLQVLQAAGEFFPVGRVNQLEPHG